MLNLRMRRRYTLDGRYTVLTTAFVELKRTRWKHRGTTLFARWQSSYHLYSCMLRKLEKIYNKISRLL